MNRTGGRKRDPIKRFWAKVSIGNDNDCWNWTGCLGPKQYGMFWGGITCTTSHQYSYILHNGPISSGMEVMHSCDNRKCVNPKHLSLGTSEDNQRDKISKGRQSAGMCKSLSEYSVQNIRRLHLQGYKQTDICSIFYLKYEVVNQICTGRTYKKYL